MGEKSLVIGAGGDIGKAILKTLSLRGRECVGTTRQTLDLSSPDSVDKFLDSNRTEFDHIVFAAATNHPVPLLDMKSNALEEALAINIMSFIRLLQHYMCSSYGGKISSVVMISSLFGQFGRFGRLPYVMSKHALVGASKTLAIEFGGRNIRVNTISPGFIDTKLTRKNIPTERIKDLESRIPIGRLGHAQEIANAVEFLTSDKASYISGTDIVVDGGYSAGGFF